MIENTTPTIEELSQAVAQLALRVEKLDRLVYTLFKRLPAQRGGTAPATE